MNDKSRHKWFRKLYQSQKISKEQLISYLQLLTSSIIGLAGFFGIFLVNEYLLIAGVRVWVKLFPSNDISPVVDDHFNLLFGLSLTFTSILYMITLRYLMKKLKLVRFLLGQKESNPSEVYEKS